MIQKVIDWGFKPNIVKCISKILDDWFSNSTLNGILMNWEKSNQIVKPHMTPLNVLAYNTQGWGSRATEVIEFIFNSDSSIGVFSEVGELWKKFTIPHFNTFHKKGTNEKGGVLVAVGKHLKATRIEVDIDNTVIVDVEGLSEQLRIIGIYWPHCQNRNLDELDVHITENTIITGDFNASVQEWQSPKTDIRGQRIKNWIEKNKLHYIPSTCNSSKRSDRNIDLTFTNIPDTNAETLKMGTSDHWPIVIKNEHIGFVTDGSVPAINWTVYQIVLTLLQDYWTKELERANVEDCVTHYRLTAAAFSAGDPQHIAQLSQMGIQIQTVTDGRIQLVHNAANAASHDDAEDGLLFVQEMMNLMKTTGLGQASLESNYHMPLSVIPLVTPPLGKLVSLSVGSAQFGKQLHGKLGIFAQLHVAQPFSGCSELFFPHHHYSRIAIVRRGDCMFIEKARQLERVQAAGGIVIDHNTSIKASTGGVFSMTGDGNNNVHIPLVLMFKDEAFQLLHLLSKQPNLIVYIGDQKLLKESFYEHMEILESLLEPFNQTSNKWIYGQIEWLAKKQLCSKVPEKLKQLELVIHQESDHVETEMLNNQPIIQIEHVIDASGNKSAEELSHELFSSINLTATHFGGQLNNIDAYRSAFNKLIRTALATANESFKSNGTGKLEQRIEIPVEIRTTIKEEEEEEEQAENQQQTSTTTSDTREYTERRPHTNKG
ncbi:unnamed protein product [Rotaria magnacalcarata]|uniref:Endonuclease/exonuclease/phosphatase domain-containing protein n=3 Tax=Rotaria magnacalcarata TaxID=392030 RepID=A0A816Y5B2_9BILA|nr:unnamed protein product [Rotaria magnacalcarata]CAF2154591.1 unnamed protein product [Rotaria magnacalcarata]